MVIGTIPIWARQGGARTHSRKHRRPPVSRSVPPPAEIRKPSTPIRKPSMQFRPRFAPFSQGNDHNLANPAPVSPGAPYRTQAAGVVDVPHGAACVDPAAPGGPPPLSVDAQALTSARLGGPAVIIEARPPACLPPALPHRMYRDGRGVGMAPASISA